MLAFSYWWNTISVYYHNSEKRNRSRIPKWFDENYSSEIDYVIQSWSEGQCITCGKKVDRNKLAYMTRHFTTHLDKRIKCLFCGRMFGNDVCINTHIRKSHPNNK
jgi:hypothetical protein